MAIANNDGLTPLHFAVSEDSPRIFCVLLKHGADPNRVYPYSITPLIAAWDFTNWKIR